MNLEEASKLITMIAALDAKINALSKNMDTEKLRQKTNDVEIKRRIDLEKQNLQIAEHLKQLNDEIHENQAIMDEKTALLTKNGWVLPKQPAIISGGSIAM